MSTSSTSTRLVSLQTGSSRALVYPEHGFHLYAFDVDFGSGNRVELISGPVGPREPEDRRYGNPVLFPNPGAANGSKPDHWDYKGQPLLMPMHGWARNLYWHVAEIDARSVTAILTPSPQVRLAFPFTYELKLRYELRDRALVLTTSLTNTSAEPFPYALGFHPYLRAPIGQGGKRDQCKIALPAGTRLRTDDGWRTIQRAPEQARVISALEPELGASIVLTDTNVRALEVEDHASRLAIRCSVEESEQSFPTWVIWSASPESRYVCLEPWTDAPNALNRPGTRTISPGATHLYSLTLSARTL